MPADEAAENNLVEDNEDLETGKDLIDVVNAWAKDRGKFKKGSNKNPVAEREKAKQAEEEAKKAEDERKAKEADKQNDEKTEADEEDAA